MPTPAEADPSSVAKRLITFTMPLTTFRRQWSSNGTGGALVNGGALPQLVGPVLAPLEPHRSKLAILDGIDITVSNSMYGTQIQPTGAPINGSSHFMLPALWTGTPQLATTPQSFDDIQPGYAYIQTGDMQASGWSIEQAVHARLKQTAPQLQSLQLGAHGPQLGWELSVGSNCVSFGAPSSPGGLAPTLFPKFDPQVVFDQLFGAFQPATPDVRTARRGSVLDMLVGRMSRLRAQLPTEDRVRLDQHQQGIADLEARLKTTNTNPQCVEPARNGSLSVAQTIADPRGNARTLFELVRLAFECDLVRCVSFMCGYEATTIAPQNWDSTLQAPTDPNNNGLHELSHEADSDAYAAAAMLSYNRSMMACLADLATTLETGSNTMQQTIIAASGTLYDSNEHSTRIPPFYLLAGSQTPIKTNQYRCFSQTLNEIYGTRTGAHIDRQGALDSNRLLTTLGQAMGLTDMQTFGYVGTYNFYYNATQFDAGGPVVHTPIAELLQ